MQIFTIDHNQETVKICGFPSLENATDTLCPEGMSRDIVRSREDLGELSEDVLLRAYNFKKTGKALAALGKNRKRVEAGLWALLQHKDEPQETTDNKPPSDNSELTSSSEDGTKAQVSDPADKQTEAKVAAKKRGSTKKAKAAKAVRKAKTAKVKSKRTATGPRGEKTLKVRALLLRKNGCTRKDILEATGWPTISVQAIAKNCNLKLKKIKEKGQPSQYFGEEKSA